MIAAQNIFKKYGAHTALDHVSINFHQGKVVGLLGPNGAGKTSLIRILNQITAPDSGVVYFNGRPIVGDDSILIGYLPEERGLYKKMEVAEQVIYLARLKGMSRHDAQSQMKEWFSRFEMLAWTNKKIEELSKGMQQKVQFIVAAIHHPQVLILDEPFSGFDPINADLIKTELLKLKKEGVTLILSTHNMNSVEELCDEIALINNGYKILDGNVREIRSRYSNNTWEITFVGNSIQFTIAIGAMAQLIAKQEEQDICKVRLKLSKGVGINEIIHAVLPCIQLIKIQEFVPGMNDIFIAAVNEHSQMHPQNE